MSPEAPPPAGKGDSQRRRAQRELQDGADLRVAGLLDEAIGALLRAIETAREADDAELGIAAARELGLTLLASSRLREAEEVLAGVLQQSEVYFGEASPQWAAAAEELALAHRARGDLEGANELLRGAAAASARFVGPLDPVTIALERHEEVSRMSAWPALFISYSRRAYAGEWARHLNDFHLDPVTFSVDAIEGEFQILSRLLHAEAPEPREFPVYFAQSALGQVLNSEGGQYSLPDDGLDLARRVYEARSSTLGDDHPQTLNSLVLYSLAAGQRDPVQAIELGRAGALHSERVLGRTHIDTLGAYESLADILEGHGEVREAQRLRGENVELRIADADFHGEEQPPVVNVAGTLTEPLTNVLDAVAPDRIYRIRSDPPMRAPAEDVAISEAVFDYTASDVAADEPAAAEALSGPPQNAELVHRTAHLELDPPDPIGPGERFRVLTYVDNTPAEAPGTSVLVISPPAGVDELTLSAWLVVSRHFEIVGKAIRSLPLDLRKTHSPKLIFHVHATHIDEYLDEDPEVRVLFSYRGWSSGEVRLPVPLAQTVGEISP